MFLKSVSLRAQWQGGAGTPQGWRSSVTGLMGASRGSNICFPHFQKFMSDGLAIRAYLLPARFLPGVGGGGVCYSSCHQVLEEGEALISNTAENRGDQIKKEQTIQISLLFWPSSSLYTVSSSRPPPILETHLLPLHIPL